MDMFDELRHLTPSKSHHARAGGNTLAHNRAYLSRAHDRNSPLSKRWHDWEAYWKGNFRNWDSDRAVEYLVRKATANGKHSTGRCAHYTADAIEHGFGRIGLKSYPEPTHCNPATGNLEVWATDFAGYLRSNGFVPLLLTKDHRKGDVIIIQGIPDSPKEKYGHMAMYDGNKWISDYMPIRSDSYPNIAYRTHKPKYSIFRHVRVFDW